MINNYYNIPAIPCSERLNITQSNTEQNEKCQGLNPNNIHQTLYPSIADPLINYTQQENLGANGEVLKTINADSKTCATDCQNNPICKHLEISKPDNVCKLFKDTETTPQSMPQEFPTKVFRKNDLLENSQSCDINDNFIEQPYNYFPKSNPIRTISEPNISQKECLTACAYDENCNTVSFSQSNNVCKQYSKITNTYRKNKSKIYNKNNEITQNRFDAPNSLEEYYKEYSKDGREKDYFCEFIPATNKCETSYIVGKNGEKNKPRKSHEKPDYKPPPTLCLPPKCIPKEPCNDEIGKLRLNNNIRLTCPPNDEECNKRITENTPFSTDFMGLPTANGEPNPANPYLPYTSEYKEYKNTQINSQELTNKPGPTAFDFPEDCEKWCKDSTDCGGVSYTLGTDGRAQCKYYKDVGTKKLRDSLTDKEYTNSKIKKGNAIDIKPKKNNLRKPYFNNLEPEANTKKVCVTPGSTTESFTNQSDLTQEWNQVQENLQENFANQYDWTQVPGGLKQVSLDNNVVCGVNSADDIYCADQNIESNPNWRRIDGKLKHVSVNKGRLYGVNSNDQIWFTQDYKNPRWRGIPGSLKQVELDGNVVCGVNSGNGIWCADSNIESNPNWFNVPGGLNHVSINNGRLYGTNPQNQIWYAKNYRNAQWQNIPGGLKQVELNDNVVCGVNSGDQIWCADSKIESNPNWKNVPGRLKYVSINNDRLYGVNSSDSIFYRGTYKERPPEFDNNSPAEIAKCNRKNPNYCIFKDYTPSGNFTCNAPPETGGAYNYGGLNTYNDEQTVGWLKALYDRNAGSNPQKGERANVYDYYQRCKDFPGYEYLKPLNFINPFEKTPVPTNSVPVKYNLQYNNVGKDYNEGKYYPISGCILINGQSECLDYPKNKYIKYNGQMLPIYYLDIAFNIAEMKIRADGDTIWTTNRDMTFSNDFCYIGGLPDPETMSLQEYQKIWSKIGCKSNLKENDIKSWRQKPLKTIIDNMIKYNKLASTCSGNKEQNELCKPGTCYPDIPDFNDKNYGPCLHNPNIQKEDSWGSNCPIEKFIDFNDCTKTQYGCCPDGETPKVNTTGDNCETYSHDECIKSKNGCCPGTTVPKKFICEENDDTTFCQNNLNKTLTNCELSPKQTGDPYEYGTQKGASCKTKANCPPTQDCSNGYCQAINKKFYNTINNENQIYVNKKSGSQLNDLICGKFTPTGSNKECPDKYEPICGSDGKTYKNDCISSTLGIDTQYYGACDKIIENFANREFLPKEQTNMWSKILFFSVLLIFILVITRKIGLKNIF